jgi:hypothetical protein
MLHNGDWSLVTGVSGQPIGPIFMEAVQEDGTDRLSRNVVNYYSTLRNFPQRGEDLVCTATKPEITQSDKSFSGNVLYGTCSE